MPLANWQVDGQPQTYLTLTYTRRTDDDSLAFLAETTADLAASWIAFDGIEEISAHAGEEIETVILIDSQSTNETTKRFLRVSVER